MSFVRWIEIPVEDIERASDFYSLILNVELPVVDLSEEMGSILAMLPDQNGVGGALVQNTQHGYVPSQQGTLVYVTVGQENLEDALARAQEAGAQIVLPKTSLGENGYCAWMIDSEGNRIGLHSTV